MKYESSIPLKKPSEKRMRHYRQIVFLSMHHKQVVDTSEYGFVLYGGRLIHLFARKVHVFACEAIYLWQRGIPL